MQRFALLMVSVFMLASQAYAQNPLWALLGNSAGSEERLLYKKPAGPYEITIMGERLLERAYFKIEVKQDGQPVSADTQVRVKISPPESAGSEVTTYTASYDGERFIVDPLSLSASSDWGDASWLVDLELDGAAGKASTSFGMQVYAPKPDQSVLFKTLNVILPVAVLLIFLGIFALSGVKLERLAPA